MLPSDATLHQAFQRIASQHPQQTALLFEDTRVSYDQLEQRAELLAARLRSDTGQEGHCPLRPDTPIAVCMDRGPEMIVALLAVLKVGCAYLPIAPEWPWERKRRLMEHSSCRLMVVDARSRNGEFSRLLPEAQLMEQPAAEGCSDADARVAPSSVAPSRPSPAAGHDLAYLMYTSGTTGTPKGVLVEHRSVLNLCAFFQRRFSLNSESVVLQLSPISFDASVSEIFPTLLSGGCLLLLDEVTRLDPTRLQALMQQRGVTMATFLPSLLAHLDPGSAERPALPALQHIVVAGECASEDVIRRWASGRNLVNGYGPTEATVCSTMQRLTGQETDPTCLGRPIDNMDVYVLDEELKPVPPGKTGELYISGIGLAREYLGQPELTQESFVANPFTGLKQSGARMYRSGDWVRVGAEGSLHFVGRRDEQVKIRGHRIELGEVKAAILRCAGVCQAAVTVRQVNARPDRKELVAYYVSDDGLTEGGLKEQLTRRLPSYLRPARYQRLETFPLTPNGKIELGRLPAPSASPTRRARPRTRTERVLFELWSAVLGSEDFGLDESFFEVGGDSLLAVALAVKISDHFGVQTDTSTVYKCPTIDSQARHVDSTGHRSYQPLRSFRTTGARQPPLFFVHPSMTGAAVYEQMSDSLAANQPFFGIESYNCFHSRRPEVDLRSLASRYVDAIQEVQPDGICFLGGYSAGGNIAYEMARQLQQRGGGVRKLYLVDSTVPWLDSARTGEVSLQDAMDFLDYFGLSVEGDEGLLRLAKAEMDLLFSYQPEGKLASKAVLFRATQPLGALGELSAAHVARRLLEADAGCNSTFSGWDRWVEEVDLYQVEADHKTIVGPEHIGHVAEKIQADIDASQQGLMRRYWR